MFLHVLSIMYSSSAFYARNPALEIIDQQKNTCTKGIFDRRTLYTQHPVSLRTSIPDANSVILRAHLCTAAGSMLKTLCSKLFMRRV